MQDWQVVIEEMPATAEAAPASAGAAGMVVGSIACLMVGMAAEWMIAAGIAAAAAPAAVFADTAAVGLGDPAAAAGGLKMEADMDLKRPVAGQMLRLKVRTCFAQPWIADPLVL